MTVAVHAGAGKHSNGTVKQLMRLCAEACKEGIIKLKEGADSSMALTTAIHMMEDSPLTNAGYGSCLTVHGTVECDASIMRGDGACGIVGAVNGVRNPITLARRVLVEQSQGLMSLGRVPPVCLCGEGARVWARQHGIPVCEPDELISDCSKEVYVDHMSKLNDSFEGPPTKKPAVDSSEDKQTILDTVGGLCMDSAGVVSACCSSGGISLKHPGRVGQAGMYGCGCYAQGHPGTDRVAVTTSGVGETLIKTSLAKSMACSVLSSDYSSIIKSFNDVYINSPLLDNHCPKLAGVLVLNALSSGKADLSWVHSTVDMLIAYMSINDESPSVILSHKANKSSQVCAGGVAIKL